MPWGTTGMKMHLKLGTLLSLEGLASVPPGSLWVQTLHLDPLRNLKITLFGIRQN